MFSFFLVVSALLPSEASPKKLTFNEHIRPILTENCFACHGPDSSSREAELRLDLRDGAVESGAVLPGDPNNSELIARITSDDSDLMMPPKDSHKKLSEQEKQILARWIEEGAEWEKHWAFIKPKRPELPKVGKVEGWARNPIDYFIFAKLRELNLAPNGPENKYVLGRRISLDITGMPPAKSELDEFVNSAQPDAYTRFVDQLLSSEHAGEHRARYWLDAARYGDTHGMHVDNYREIWPYRDWVVDAFNNNMPFDQFVVEQIAGDLLPNASLPQRIATGFNRCNITTSEGGAIPEEVAVRYMVDRVETTATVFLGLTAGCAVCHDHKYDPISQREFYQLGAFFNNTTQPPMDGNQKDTPPVVTLPAAEHQEEWDTLLSQRQALRDQLSSLSSSAEKWWPTRHRQLIHPVGDEGLIVDVPLTEGGGVDLPDGATWDTEHPAGERGIRYGEKAAAFTVDMPQVRSDEPLSITFWIRTPDKLMSTSIFEQMGKTEKGKAFGWKINSSTQGALTFELIDSKGNKVRGLLPGEEALTPRSWQHVCVRYSGGQSNSSISIVVNGRVGVLRNSTETFVEATPLAEGKLKVGSRLPTGGLSDIRIFRRWITDEETKVLMNDHRLRNLVESERDWENLTTNEQRLVNRYHKASIDEAGKQALATYSQTQRRRDYIYSRSVTTLVMQERAETPRAWVLDRGEYDQKRDEVSPDVPAVLRFESDAIDFAPDSQPNRMQLAKWLVHPDNPLTARVMVNRLWQSVFGTGLVKTSEDFGVMGSPPSHPELLDWLAVEFVESGWDMRHMLRLMLTSSAYRQSNRVTQEKLDKDAENRYLSRGPRIRLDAEVLRDQALAISGLLNREMGGPSVKPYQPAGLWKVVAITGSNTRFFKKDTGDKLYRRSLYTFWKRTSPPPSMAAFNAPTREQCTVRRERTNTPIQALVLLNDPQFVEAARHFAQRALKKHGNVSDRARWMFEQVVLRPASESDVNELAQTAAELKELFTKEKESAESLVVVGDSPVDKELDAIELAAWTMIGNTLLNRDDVINK